MFTIHVDYSLAMLVNVRFCAAFECNNGRKNLHFLLSAVKGSSWIISYLICAHVLISIR